MTETLPCPTCSGTRRVRCSHCGGTGHAHPLSSDTFCSQCNGRCHVTCTRCNGSGKVADHRARRRDGPGGRRATRRTDAPSRLLGIALLVLIGYYFFM